jgi:hypothetical protein
MGLSPDEVAEFFSIYRMLPAVLGPEVYSACNKNKCQKNFLGVKRSRSVRLIT